MKTVDVNDFKELLLIVFELANLNKADNEWRAYRSTEIMNLISKINVRYSFNEVSETEVSEG
jgi:hypothetical protein